MNILITGTSGFVGNELRKYYMEQGHCVTGTVGRKEPREGEVKLNLADWNTFETLKKRQFDIIIHSAAALEGSPSKTMHKVNVTGTENMIRLARKVKCAHFIHISSIAIYGLKAIGEKRSENTKRSRVTTPYGRTKSKAEVLMEKSGLDYTILRLPSVIGSDDSYVSPVIKEAIAMEKPFYLNRKDKKISILNISNLPHIMDKVMEKGASKDYYNCIDHMVRWSDFIWEYSRYKGSRPRFREKSFIKSIINCLFDNNKRFTTLIGHLGMHHENGKLIRAYSLEEFPFSWQEAVRDACISDSYYTREKSPKATNY